MKIMDVKVIPVAVPLSQFSNYEPVTMWYGTRYASRRGVVIIDTDEGVTGVGISREQSIDLIVNKFKPNLIGLDPFDVKKIESLTKTLSAGLRPEAVAAIDHACWDIIGKICKKPVYKLIGGKVHDKIQCEFWECCKSPDEIKLDIEKGIELGWRNFKIKIGTDPPTDIQRVKAAREAAGDEIELGFDANDAYSVPTAIRTIKKMERYDPAYVEQPTPSWDIDGLADVKAHTNIPIVCHSFYVTKDKKSTLELVKKNAADIININPDYMGSLLYCQEIASIAEAGGIISKCQSTCAELGPANAGLLHMITATRGFSTTHQNSCHHLEVSGDIIKEPFLTVHGSIKVPEKPGLGVELDKEKIEKWNQTYLQGKYQDKLGIGRKDVYHWNMSFR